MNREYANSASCHSNSGIYEAFYAEIGRPRQSILYGLRARLVMLLRALFTVLAGATARRVARVACATGAMVGLVGVAGALETGRISPVACLLLAAVLLLAAYLCMRPRRKTTAQKRA